MTCHTLSVKEALSFESTGSFCPSFAQSVVVGSLSYSQTDNSHKILSREFAWQHDREEASLRGRMHSERQLRRLRQRCSCALDYNQTILLGDITADFL